jgi:hypothetical protein
LGGGRERDSETEREGERENDRGRGRDYIRNATLYGATHCIHLPHTYSPKFAILAHVDGQRRVGCVW